MTTLAYDEALCTGCGRCTEVCPHRVFEMRQPHAAVVDRDRCMECGACAANCESGALSVSPGVGCAGAMIIGILRYGDPDRSSCDCDASAGSDCYPDA